MPTLHTVNKSPFERRALDRCLDHALDGAAVLLLEDGVYAALAATHAGARVAGVMSRLHIYVLGPDLAARGIANDRMVPGLTVVDYEGFVSLAVKFDKVHAWL
jgi:tRNA 2-thiouridine synthesizing protein B